MKKRIISLLLALLCLLSFTVACSDDAAVDTAVEPGADETDTELVDKEYNYVVDENMFNIIEADGTSKYDIVRADNAPDVVGVACVELRNAIKEATGVELEVKSDFEKKGSTQYQRQDYEIVVGYTNRDESAHAAELVDKARDFVILQEGTRLAILAKSNAHISDAVAYFIENYIDQEKCSVALEPETKHISKFEYPIKSFTLNGIDMSEYTIVYGGDADYEYAEMISKLVLENYGESVALKKGTSDAENIIAFCNINEDAEPIDVEPFETKIQVDGTKIIFAYGELASVEVGVSQFVEKYFNEEIIAENIEIVIDSYSFVEENEYITIDNAELLASIDEKAAARRKYIENTPNNFTELPEGSTARIYYLAEDGSDTNDGLSEATAFQTIDRLNIVGLLPGDVVLFKRGDEFRGKVKLRDGVTYSSYGTGPKPVINGSKRNFADPGVWTTTDVENVYKCSYLLDNVGNIVFDYSGIIGNYDEKIAQMKITGVKDFVDYKDLANDLEFWSDLNTKELYLYSENGNPGSRFKSIEICEAGNVFQGSNKDVTVDNLTVIFGGSHGVGSGTVKNRTVQNCVFAWIGGSILKGFNGGNVTRYGNAVEVYGGCDGYYVYDNWIYQIYDTGITHQYSLSDKVIKMENIEYRGNIVELCHWSIEYYNRGSMPGSCLNNIHVHDNMTLYGCYGWGSVGRESGGALHNSFQIIDEVNNYLVENNIFAYSKGNLVRYNEGGDRKIEFKNNTYVQYYNRALGYMFGTTEKFDRDVTKLLVETMHEENPVICYIMHDAEREAEEAAKAEAEAKAKAEAEAEAE